MKHKRKTASLKRVLAAADDWSFCGTVETTDGTVEIYMVDGIELRFGRDDALREYHARRAPEWQRASK
jgi:hypothetical protein